MPWRQESRLGDSPCRRNTLALAQMKCYTLRDGGGSEWAGTGTPCPGDDMSPSNGVMVDRNVFEREGTEDGAGAVSWRSSLASLLSLCHELL